MRYCEWIRDILRKNRNFMEKIFDGFRFSKEEVNGITIFWCFADKTISIIKQLIHRLMKIIISRSHSDVIYLAYKVVRFFRVEEECERVRAGHFKVVCVNVCVLEALSCNLAVTRCQRKRRVGGGNVFCVDRGSQGVEQLSGTKPGLWAGALLHFLSQHYCSQSGRLKHCVSSDPSLRETTKSPSDRLNETDWLTDWANLLTCT